MAYLNGEKTLSIDGIVAYISGETDESTGIIF